MKMSKLMSTSLIHGDLFFVRVLNMPRDWIKQNVYHTSWLFNYFWYQLWQWGQNSTSNFQQQVISLKWPATISLAEKREQLSVLQLGWGYDGLLEQRWMKRLYVKRSVSVGNCRNVGRGSSSQFGKGDTSVEACLNLVLIATASGASWNQLQNLRETGLSKSKHFSISSQAKKPLSRLSNLHVIF